MRPWTGSRISSKSSTRQARDPLRHSVPGLRLAAAVAVMLAVVTSRSDLRDPSSRRSKTSRGESAALPTLTQLNGRRLGLLKGYWFIWCPQRSGPSSPSSNGRKTDAGRAQWDRVKLRLPMHIGDIVQKAAVRPLVADFSGAVASGVPLLEAITLTGQYLRQFRGRGGDG